MTEVTVEEFLAHHGVKGQRWGVRREGTAGGATGAISSGVNKVRLTAANTIGSPEMKARAAAAGKVAFTVGRLGLPPVLAATGVGVPVVAGVAASMRLIGDPDVRAAVAAAGAYSASVVKDIGDTTMKSIREAKILYDPQHTLGVNRERLKTEKIMDKNKIPDKPGGMKFNPNAKIDQSQIQVRVPNQ